MANTESDRVRPRRWLTTDDLADSRYARVVGCSAEIGCGVGDSCKARYHAADAGQYITHRPDSGGGKRGMCVLRVCAAVGLLLAGMSCGFISCYMLAVWTAFRETCTLIY